MKQDQLFILAGMLMLCCCSSSMASIAYPALFSEEATGPTGPGPGPTGPGPGPSGPSGPTGPGPGPAGPNQPISGVLLSRTNPLTTPTTDHPLAGEHFLVRAAPFGNNPLPAIIPDPNNENLVAFDQGKTKQDSSKMIFEIVSGKPNRYKLKNKGTGKYWSYWIDGLWKWTSTPGIEHELLFEYMRMDDGEKMYRLSNLRDNSYSLYFGYLYDGKAKTSFEPSDIQDGNQLFKVVDA